MLQTPWQTHWREASVVVAAKSNLRSIPSKFAEVQYVFNTIIDGCTATFGEKRAVEVETNDASACEEFACMVVSKMTLILTL